MAIVSTLSSCFQLKVLILLLLILTIGAASARPEPPSMKQPEVQRSLVMDVNGMKVFRVLAKGDIPPSGPSNKGHGAPNFTRHLLQASLAHDPGRELRALSSVPSPGVGH